MLNVMRLNADAVHWMWAVLHTMWCRSVGPTHNLTEIMNTVVDDCTENNVLYYLFVLFNLIHKVFINLSWTSKVIQLRSLGDRPKYLQTKQTVQYYSCSTQYIHLYSTNSIVLSTVVSTTTVPYDNIILLLFRILCIIQYRVQYFSTLV